MSILIEAEDREVTVRGAQMKDRVAGKGEGPPGVVTRIDLCMVLDDEAMGLLTDPDTARSMVAAGKARAGGDGANTDRWAMRRDYAAFRFSLQGETETLTVNSANIVKTPVFLQVEGVGSLRWTVECSLDRAGLQALGAMLAQDVVLNATGLQGDLLDGIDDEAQAA